MFVFHLELPATEYKLCVVDQDPDAVTFRQHQLLVCQTGSRSAQVCATLQKDGLGEPMALSGGMAAWQQASMPVEKDK